LLDSRWSLVFIPGLLSLYDPVLSQVYIN
jgi:hypothetical protein